jgi:para-nitrobenzyl esterase
MNRKCGSRKTISGVLRAMLFAIAVLIGFTAVHAVSNTGSDQSSIPFLADPIKTGAGYVSGTLIGDAGKEVRIYRGIPYAAPPVGDLRWKPPQPVVPWQGVRECTQLGPWATQLFPTGEWAGSIPESQMSEDCLYLNLLTPAKAAKEKLPVMVWLHGGGLDAGSSNQPVYNTPYLPQHGVVLVSVGHRLGAMGFLAHPALSAESPNHASGNYGMLDVIAALNWVQKNIAAFGGDPGCVTVFGQSGGGAKVIWLMASPLAKGLFHRAIVEAGIGAEKGRLTGSAGDIFAKAEAEKQGEKLAAKLGAKSISEFRSRTWQEIVKALPVPGPSYDDAFKMRYTVDGWALNDTPFNIFSKGLGNAVPVLIGAGESETARHQALVLWAPLLLKANPNLYVYMFSHVPTNWKNAGLKAYHGLEISYHFGDISAVAGNYNTQFTAAANLPKDPGLDKKDELVAESSMMMWTQFAATGNPSVGGLIKWPAFKTVPGKDTYLNIAVPLELKSGFIEKYKP